MRHSFFLLLLAFFPALIFGQSVTVANSMAKIHPSDGPTSATTAEIHAAQNEFESFQLIVTGPAAGVSATVSTLAGPGGSTIPAGEVRLYREAYLNITTPSNTEGGTGMWPDVARILRRHQLDSVGEPNELLGPLEPLIVER